MHATADEAKGMPHILLLLPRTSSEIIRSEMNTYLPRTNHKSRASVAVKTVSISCLSSS